MIYLEGESGDHLMQPSLGRRDISWAIPSSQVLSISIKGVFLTFQLPIPVFSSYGEWVFCLFPLIQARFLLRHLVLAACHCASFWRAYLYFLYIYFFCTRSWRQDPPWAFSSVDEHCSFNHSSVKFSRPLTVLMDTNVCMHTQQTQKAPRFYFSICPEL